MVRVDIQESGVINLVHPTHEEIVRLYIQLEDEDRVKVTCKVKPNYLYSNRLYERLPLDLDHVKEMVPGFNVEPLYLDESRTTPKYADHYNEVLRNVVPNAYPISSYASGYTFIGEAFINFALALAVYEKFPDEDTHSLMQLLNLYRNNKYVASICNMSGWSRYLTKSFLDHKSVASSYKGLIGAIYKSNGVACVPELLEYVNKNLMTNTPVQLNRKKKDWVMMLALSLTGLVVGALSTYTIMGMLLRV